MNDDFSRYEAMKSEGADAPTVYEAARADGLKTPACIRMLRGVFGLGLGEAKDAMLAARGTSREVHEEGLVDAVEAALED